MTESIPIVTNRLVFFHRIRLSKVISQRWHDLPLNGKVFYRLVAQIDEAHYKRSVQRSTIKSSTTTNSESETRVTKADEPDGR